MKTDKRTVLSRIDKVANGVRSEITDNAKGGHVAAGLSMEGFAGGYLAALEDVEAALRHGYPSDHRGYWRRAERG